MMTMKSALITGAASGIGKACAERMAQEGYGVVVADVNLPAAEELAAKLAAEGLSAIAVHMDVADEQEVAKIPSHSQYHTMSCHQRD